MTPTPAKVPVPDLFTQIPGPYQPHLIGTIDSAYDIKIAKIEGPFIWHTHPDADEVFYIVKGELTMGIRVDGEESEVILKQGELFKVPQGMEHRPDSKQGCEVIIIEKKGTVNTGDVVGSDRTVEVKDARGQV
jgi:mannose-6-phosphate isomerase-like protein (cupin superfamily)